VNYESLTEAIDSADITSSGKSIYTSVDWQPDSPESPAGWRRFFFVKLIGTTIRALCIIKSQCFHPTKHFK